MAIGAAVSFLISELSRLNIIPINSEYIYWKPKVLTPQTAGAYTGTDYFDVISDSIYPQLST